jgi:hypothetical protein
MGRRRRTRTHRPVGWRRRGSWLVDQWSGGGGGRTGSPANGVDEEKDK